jgi:hypothetical protein
MITILALDSENVTPKYQLTSSAQIANATQLHVSIPWGGICSASLSRQLLLSEADTGLRASVGTYSTLASNTLIVGEAGAFAGSSIADTSVGAFYHRVSVVGIDNGTNPGGVGGAGAARAVGEGPGRISVNSVIAGAFVVSSTRAMSTAPVGAISTHACESAQEKSYSNLHHSSVILYIIYIYILLCLLYSATEYKVNLNETNPRRK